MADPIERRDGARRLDLATGVTKVDRFTSSISQENRGRNRWGLPLVVVSITTILVFAGLVRSFSEPNREVLIRAFSEIPRTKVAISGVMSSQRPGFLNYPDCTREQPTKSGKIICWNQERFSKP